VDGLPAIPVIGDLNTLQYSLKKGLGDSILFPDADQPEYALQVVGMLDSSIFQGVLVLSDQNLKRIAPEVTGKEWFLVETANAADVEPTASALETALRVYGFDTERVSERLAGFLAVQNTYLSTFQMLGALGLLVGTVGLGAVMLRNVLERRSEIALMLAVGFTRFRITTLIIAENTMLLMWGMVTGTVSAFLAILPHLLSTGADVSWPLLGATLAAVLLFGSLAVVLPIAAATRTSIREGLAAA
jgi:putative ABC transport system permease protein